MTLGGISESVKCLFNLYVKFCLLFAHVLANDYLLLLKTKLLNITEWQKKQRQKEKGNIICVNSVCGQHRKHGYWTVN